MYSSIGFQVPADFKEPEDHIAMQFKFMAVLSKKIGGAIEVTKYEDASRLLDIQNKFIVEHLNKWIPQCCRLLISAAKERNFYQAIAHLTEGFLAMDYELIQREMSQAIRQTQPGDSIQAGV
jgi:TorA maturation chaperone TorD